MIKINRPTSSLTHFMLNLVKSYKRLFALIALIGLLWAFINTLLPYTLKLIIDHVASFTGNKDGLLKTIQPYAFAYIAFWVALCINMRFLDWVKLKLYPNLRADVMNGMFSYLNQHSHQYFQNNFAGSLMNKISDMQNGVIDIFTTLDDLFAQTLGLSVAIIILLFIHPIFAVILMGWTLMFIAITFLGYVKSRYL